MYFKYHKMKRVAEEFAPNTDKFIQILQSIKQGHELRKLATLSPYVANNIT